MSLVDLPLYAPIAVYPLFVLAERAWPAREQPRLRGWALTGIGFFVAFMATSVLLPLALPASWFEASLLPGAELGVAGGTVVGYLATTLAGYAWHRAAHRVPLLWRVFHQMHHAPRRLDAIGSFVFHPTEAALYTLLGAAVNVMVLGLDPVAASLVGFLGAFNAVFQHANLRTPRSDFPLWDRLLGTYRPGRGFQPQVGFDARESAGWVAMAALRDVHEPAFGVPRAPVARRLQA